MVPPHAALPDGFEVSNEGLAVPPVPTRGDLREKITERRHWLPDWKRALPKYAARSDYWRRRFAHERRKALGLCNAHLRAVLPHVPNVLAEARHAAFMCDANAAG